MTAPQVPVDGKTADWPRRVANAVNWLLPRAITKSGADIYIAPTISDPPTQAEVQAIADALAAVSIRLK